jgi:hypothetical protein
MTMRPQKKSRKGKEDVVSKKKEWKERRCVNWKDWKLR